MIRLAIKLGRAILPLEFWIVGIAVAFTFAYPRALPLAVGIAAGFWLLRGFVNRRLSVSTPADWAIILLLLTIPMTLSVTIFPELTRLQVYRLLSGIALYYAVANWATTLNRLRWVVGGIVSAGFMLALFATVSVEWFADKLPFIPASIYNYFRILVADTVNPNVMAGSLVVLVPLALAVLLFARRQIHWTEFIIIGLSAFVMIAVLVLTQSRGAWISFGIVLGIMAVLRWRWAWLGVVALVAYGGVAAYHVGYQRILDLLLSSTMIGGIERRMEIWSRAISMIQDFPFTGIGMGSFGAVGDILYPLINFVPEIDTHAHNLFLQVAIDLGIPGLIGWMWVLITCIAAAWRTYWLGKRSSQSWMAGVGAGLLLSQLAMIIHGLFDAVTWGMVKPAPLVWVVWGMSVASWNVANKNNAGE